MKSSNADVIIPKLLNQGMLNDVEDKNNPKLVYSLNTVYSKKYDSRNTEESTTPVYTSTSGNICGIIPLDENDFVIFKDTSELVYLKISISNNNTSVFEKNIDNVFNFNLSVGFPIKGVFDYNFKREVILAWIDANNAPRVLNIGTKETLVITDMEQLEDTLVFPKIVVPKVTGEVYTGGSVNNGCYFLGLAYLNDNDETNIFSVTGPYWIGTGNTGDMNDYFGGKEDESSGNGFIFIATECDLNYDSIVPYIIKFTEGEQIVNKLERVPLGSTTRIVYTGGESITPSILNLTAGSYTSAAAIGNHTGELWLGDLKSEEVDLQPLANDIEILFTSEDSASYKTIEGTNKISFEKTLAPSEVYALYLQGLKTDGSYTRGYHIPGRQAYDFEIITRNSDDTGDVLSTFNVKDRIIDLRNNPSSYNPSTFELDLEIANNLNEENYLQIFHTRDTSTITQSDSNGLKGKLGYWENKDEIYPNGMGLSGNVRHHVMPSLAQLLGGIRLKNPAEKLPKISLSIENFEQKLVQFGLDSKIIGYRICYAKRDYTNATVFGTDHVRAMTETTLHSIGLLTVFSAGGNWGTAGVTNSGDTYYQPLNHNFLQCKTSSLLRNKPSEINNITHVQLEYTYQRNGINLTYDEQKRTGSFLESNANIIRRVVDNVNESGSLIYTKNFGNSMLGTMHRNLPIVLTKFIPMFLDSIRYTGRFLTINSNPNVQKDEDYDFPNDYSMQNKNLPIRLTGRFSEEFLLLVSPFGRYYWGSGSGININYQYKNGVQPYFPMASYGSGLYTIRAIKTNVYTSFFNQKLISLPLFKVNDNVINYDGDNFITINSHLAIGCNLDQMLVDAEYTEPLEYTRHVRTLMSNLVYDTDISMLNYEGEDVKTKFYPKSAGDNPDVTNINASVGVEGWGKGLYNVQYSKLNELEVITVAKPNIDFVNEFPFRVIRSNSNQQEAQRISWKSFNPGAYTELKRRDWGAVTNFSSKGDELIIHQERGLSVTRGVGRLDASSTLVTIGVGDILQYDPAEPIPVNYAGLTNRMYCWSFKGGYIFIDTNLGKVFLYADTLKEISNDGFRFFFAKYFTNTEGSVFNGDGVTVAYDEKYNRILLSGGDQIKFTLSYSLDRQEWMSFHSYNTDYLFATDRQLYGIKENTIYLLNTGYTGNYIDTVDQECVLDIPFKLTQGTEGFFKAFMFDAYVEGNHEVSIDKFSVRNRTQHTGIVDVIIKETIEGIDANLRKRKDYWYLNGIRDIIANRNFSINIETGFNINVNDLDNFLTDFDKKRFIGNFIVLRLVWKANKNLSISEVSVKLQVTK